MNRQEKELFVKSLKQDFINSKASFFVNYRGLSVFKIGNLRKELKGTGGELRVAKIRLIKIALKDHQFIDELNPYLKDQLAVVFSKNDATNTAKVLNEFAKNNEEISIVVGAYDSKILDREKIIFLANLPSKEVVLAQLFGTLKAPVSQLTIILNNLIVRLLWVLNQIAENKSKN